MYLLQVIVLVFILELLLIQLVSCKIISFDVEGVTYEYDNETKSIGKGSFATVFKGYRKDRNQTEIVAFKELNKWEENRDLKSEADIFEKIGSHESIPKFYYYLSESSRNQSQIIVTELLGENLRKLFKKSSRFSTVTVMKIGLQVLNVLEHIHSKGFIHNDVQESNLAIGYQNRSRIYIFDFNGSRKYTINKTNDELQDERRYDLVRLAHVLITLAQGDYLRNNDDDDSNEGDDEVDCLDALEVFLSKSQHPQIKKPDYDELRRILINELEKRRNEPNYDQFDWEK